LVIGLDTGVQARPQLLGNGLGFIVAGCIGSNHDRPQVTKIELVHLGQRSVGSVSPFGRLQFREEILGDLDHRGGSDLGSARFLGFGVLLVDGGPYRSHTTLHHLLGDGSKLLGNLCQHCGAMLPLRSQALRLRPLLGLGTGSALAASAIACPLAASAIAAATVAAATVVVASTTAAAAVSTALGPRCTRLGDELVVADGTRLQFEEVVAFLLLLRGEDLDHLDAIEQEVGFDLADVADRSALVEHGRIDHALRLLGSGGPPRPRPVVSGTREFNFDTARHGNLFPTSIGPQEVAAISTRNPTSTASGMPQTRSSRAR
jgi:hypothetical protein